MQKILDLDKMEGVKAFIGTKPSSAFYRNSTHIVGFSFDGTASFRPGARFGPDAIRESSFGLETYSPYLKKDLEEHSIIDCGNLPAHPSQWKITNDYFHSITQNLELQKDKIKILTLGGEHSIAYGPIRLCLDQYQDLLIIHLDAHADLRDAYLGEKFSHACIIRRVWSHMKEEHSLLQYGIRSGLKAEFDFMREHNSLVDSLSQLLNAIDQQSPQRPIYLTLDLDFFDPAYVPGTGTPEAGGESFNNFMSIVKALESKNFVGADITELAPQIDPTGSSSCFASKVTREVLLALGGGSPHP